MNPYINSINGWGGGFIAFYPSYVVVVIDEESIIVTIIDLVTGLPTAGINVQRGRSYPLEVSATPAIVVMQDSDTLETELVADLGIARIRVNLDAIARKPADQVETTLNLIREEITVALMTDYKLGLSYVEGIFEQGAEEPEITDDGDAPLGRLRSVWDVIYEKIRTAPAN